MAKPVVIGVDIGASSGRVVAGRVGPDGTIETNVVHRFPNGVVEDDGHLRWDFDRLLHEVRLGLAMVDGASSVGVSTWGVDYGLLDSSGHLIEQPIAYRDRRTDSVVDVVRDLVSDEEHYRISGVQHLPFNTIYQLVTERDGPRWARAERALLLPDLIVDRLGGRQGSEYTNASTTGLLDASTQQWSADLFDRMGIDIGLFPPVDVPGADRGSTATGTPIVAVGSHDTASAVAGTPLSSDRAAYVVSGTWSLVGVEVERPICTEAARAANFSNEGGVDGRIRFLRNVGGLWLLSECLRSWGRDDLDRLLNDAGAVPGGGPVVDVDAAAFIPPGDMPARIHAALGSVLDPAATVRCVLDSLANGYARTVEQAVELTGRDVDVVHIVGGGSQNRLLCQLTADACGRLVLAGPVEATARGNLLIQASVAGLLPAGFASARAAWERVVRYDPTA